jgi:hypothetical protein
MTFENRCSEGGLTFGDPVPGVWRGKPRRCSNLIGPLHRFYLRNCPSKRVLVQIEEFLNSKCTEWLQAPLKSAIWSMEGRDEIAPGGPRLLGVALPWDPRTGTLGRRMSFFASSPCELFAPESEQISGECGDNHFGSVCGTCLEGSGV